MAARAPTSGGRGAEAPTRNGQRASAQAAPVEMTVHRGAQRPSTVLEAAESAAKIYSPEEVEDQGQAIMQAVEARLKARTDQYVERAYQLARDGSGIEIAEPIGPVAPLYPYWNLLLYGPFQPFGGAGGPFLPSKIIKAGEPAFVIATVWRNPACINFACPAPSAATLMSPYELTVRLELFNFTNVSNPPAPAFTFAPLGFGNINSVLFSLGPFPAPQQGVPALYEAFLTADVTGPGAVGAVLPFAGYTTWIFDPDTEPAIFPPPLPPFGVPPFLGFVPQLWQLDIPARFLVYS
jgi:hypothetical protein